MFRVAVEGNISCVVEELNSGGNRTIVFIHGWPYNRSIFECQYAVLPQYGIRCIGVDLRGFGQSDRPARGYSYNRMADDLYKILSCLDSRKVVLCGFSMGGAVCLRYMARHRGYKVSKLVLMGAAAPSFVQRTGYPYGRTTQQMDGMIAQAYGNRPRLCGEFGRMCFATDPGEEYLSWLRRCGESASSWATIQCAESLRDEDLRCDLQKVQAPTAIFHGIHDQVCPYSFAEEMRRGIANAYIVPFENSGHALFFEEKDKCNSSLIDFINGPA